jgi:hypothetical protein
MIAARSPRWVLSFADLCLLLLGFFVLLHARSGDSRAVTEGLRAAFGGKPGAAAPAPYAAAGLFEPGQAVFRPGRATPFRAIGAGAAAAGGTVLVESRGMDQATRRFDAWELAAARTAAIARAIRAGGLDEQRIVIVMPPPRASDGDRGQALAVVVRPPR